MSSENATKLMLEGLTPYGTREEQIRVFDKHARMPIVSAAASTTQLEHVIYVARRPCRLRLIGCVGDTTVAPDNTSYATLNVFKHTTVTPATAVTMMSAATETTASGGTGTLTAWTYKDLESFKSATAGSLDLAAGDVVTFAVAKAAGGVALGTLDLYAEFEELTA